VHHAQEQVRKEVEQQEGQQGTEASEKNNQKNALLGKG